MDVHDVRCVYCGDSSTEWDHLNPLVKDKKPTGYVSEIANLVPACGKCNQSKGNKHWKPWMISSAPRAPKARNIADLHKKMDLLDAYEEKFQPSQHDFSSMIGEELWTKHWDNWRKILDMMREAQTVAAEINIKIKRANQQIEPMD